MTPLKDLCNINSYLLSCLSDGVFCAHFGLARDWDVWGPSRSPPVGQDVFRTVGGWPLLFKRLALPVAPGCWLEMQVFGPCL